MIHFVLGCLAWDRQQKPYYNLSRQTTCKSVKSSGATSDTARLFYQRFFFHGEQCSGGLGDLPSMRWQFVHPRVTVQ